MRRTNYLKFDTETDCVERQCIKCGEWWPNDDEFYHRTAQGYLYARCKACEQERRQAEYHRKTAGMNKRIGRPRNPLANSTQATRTGSSAYILDILIELLAS